MGNKIEEKAIAYVMKNERRLGNNPKDVHSKRLGYDVKSGNKCIEVKGRGKARPSFIHFSEYNDNGMEKAMESKKEYVLYVVYDIDNSSCKHFSMNVDEIKGRRIPKKHFEIRFMAEDFQ